MKALNGFIDVGGLAKLTLQ